VIVLQFEGEASTIKTLLKLKKSHHPKIKLIQIDTAIFSYEPVLKALQSMRSMPLSSELLCWSPTSTVEPPTYTLPIAIVQAIKSDPRQDLSTLLRTPKPILLDNSQVLSLLAGLTQKVSLIQGPPGVLYLLFKSTTLIVGPM
jgi:hypothetical protein